MEKKRFDLKVIQEYIDKGLIEKNDHPNLPISIYNYSRECQFMSSWDDITLNMRGTILDNDGNLVAKGFPKFFNMEEMKDIPNEKFEVFEKMDGSLGILFNYSDEWHLATRGSFTSDQAKRGMQIFKKQEEAHGSNLSVHNVYLCEIIYPENRIVCSYGDEEKLVLLAILDNYGNEFHHTHWIYDWHHPDLIVKRHDGINDYKILKSIIKDNSEGFVIKFESGKRMKIKGEEYVRLHRLLTNFSNVDIWENLKDGKDINVLLERVPDEFDSWVKNTIKELKDQYKLIEDNAKYVYEIGILKQGYTDRKEIAKILPSIASKLQTSIIFNIIDGKDYSKLIWKYIRPQYQKPFWNKEVD